MIKFRFWIFRGYICYKYKEFLVEIIIKNYVNIRIIGGLEGKRKLKRIKNK